MVWCSRETSRLLCPIGKIKSKRQQAIADRQQDLLVIAEQIMEREGFSALTMDKLVSACSYSKGTVYNHFNSKEDLFCALCIKSMKQLLHLFRRASHFEGHHRERMLAIHFAYRLHAMTRPTLFLCVLTAQTPAVREKSSAERLQQQTELDQEVTKICTSILEQAVAAGELTIASPEYVDALTFASWAISFGSNALMSGDCDSGVIERLDAEKALLFNVSLLMDGMGWLPLSREWDYQNSWQRIGSELFAAELLAISDMDKAPVSQF